MVVRAVGPVAVALLLATFACAHRPRPAQQQAGDSPVVLTPADIERAGGQLLEALRARVPNMRILRQSRGCPIITFRGRRTLHGSESPRIYVDGSEMGDTCVLDQIHVREVDRVEVFTGGFTDRPGFQPSPNGLILVFLRS